MIPTEWKKNCRFSMEPMGLSISRILKWGGGGGVFHLSRLTFVGSDSPQRERFVKSSVNTTKLIR